MKEKTIMNDPQMSCRFMMESLTNDKEFMKRRFREMSQIPEMLSDVCIGQPVDTVSRQLDRGT